MSGGRPHGVGADGERPGATVAGPARALLLLAAGAAVVAALFVLPVGAWVAAISEWAREAGAAGALAFGAAYAAAVVLFLPGSAFTLAAGLVWGPIVGVAVAWPAASAGAALSFLAGRTVARGAVSRAVARRPRLAAVEEAIARDGFRLVFLLRLSPVFPFNLVNYAAAITPVRFRDFALATAIGILPGSFLYAYLGSVLGSAAALAAGERPDAGAAGQILFWGGLAATVVVTTLVTRTARRALARSLPASSAPRPATENPA